MDNEDPPFWHNPERIVYRARVRENIYRSLSTNSLRDAGSIEEPDNVDLMSATIGSYASLDDDDSIGWSEDELDEVPEYVHYEIEDGTLIVSPRPSLRHQRTGANLARMLEYSCPSDLVAVQDAEIREYEDGKIAQCRSPDVMLVPRELLAEADDQNDETKWVQPSQVLMAIEVVSPRSRVADRITKVGQYALWRIPYYLRVEMRPTRALYEYVLDETTGKYQTPIEHTDVVEMDDPFRIRFDLSRLV
ncbi:Uma2 family endonuclease [Cryptosporangium minutisporangium]|uniref:Putative restriction endonuclease domain-containing protein n=1 Tax=Cryptosporangium minutisporangium TaxID=113569 RepID=A0ABP6TAU0_9ACTN